MGKGKIKGSPKVRPLTGSATSCPQCELEVDSGKLEAEREVAVQYDVKFGKEVISFFRCYEHDTYETVSGIKTMKDSLVYTYGNFVKFKGVFGPKIPDAPRMGYDRMKDVLPPPDAQTSRSRSSLKAASTTASGG